MEIEKFYTLNSFVSKFNNHSLDMLTWHITKRILNSILPNYYKRITKKEGKSAREYTNTNVILSLTTFPDRIRTIPLVLETLFRQTVKADRIILWLAEDQFPEKNVDITLANFVDRGLEIKYCDNIRSHKKYFYTMKENPKAIVVTCDDDIIYSEYMLERLLKTAQEHPGIIVCERAHEMKIVDGKMQSYNSWNYRARGMQGPSLLLCPTGSAGCLYPPNSLSPHVFDKEILIKKCLYADDIWLKCMSYMIGTPVIITRKDAPEPIDTIGTSKSGLAKINVDKDMNDKQLGDVTDYYSIDWVMDTKQHLGE